MKWASLFEDLKLVIKPLIYTVILSWLFGIDSFFILLGLAVFFYIMIPEWEKEESGFQKDIKEGNDLKKWYLVYPHRARHHEAKRELNRWINKAQ